MVANARRGAWALGACFAVLGAGAAFGHDLAASPHLRCTLDGSDTLICVYSRHPTGSTRTSRVGYADKGRYALSCAAGNGDNRTFRTEICRAGTGSATAFECWTQERLATWQRDGTSNDAAAREATTQLLVVSGAALQQTLLKFLVDPARLGRPNFIDGGATGADIRDYARTCGINARGAFTAEDIVSLLPALAVFGRPRP